MLHGVLNMPIDVWGDTVIDKTQRHATYRRASERIKNSTPNAKIKELIDKYDGAPMNNNTYIIFTSELQELIEGDL